MTFSFFSSKSLKSTTGVSNIDPQRPIYSQSVRQKEPWADLTHLAHFEELANFGDFGDFAHLADVLNITSPAEHVPT